MHAHIHAFFLSLLVSVNVPSACSLSAIPAIIDYSLELLASINPFSLRLFLSGSFIMATERKPAQLPIASQGQPLHLRCHATPASFPAWILQDSEPSKAPSQHPLHIWCSGSLGIEVLYPAQGPCSRVDPCSHSSWPCSLLLVQVSPQICLMQDQRCTTVHVPAYPAQGPELNPTHFHRCSPSRCS